MASTCIHPGWRSALIGFDVSQHRRLFMDCAGAGFSEDEGQTVYCCGWAQLAGVNAHQQHFVIGTCITLRTQVPQL
jgi:hypothetical protein